MLMVNNKPLTSESLTRGATVYVLTHRLVSSGTNPIGIASRDSGLRRRRDTGSAPRFGDRPRSGERT